MFIMAEFRGKNPWSVRLLRLKQLNYAKGHLSKPQSFWNRIICIQRHPQTKYSNVQQLNIKIIKNVLDWPSQSPEVNPIKHLWDHFGGKIRDKKLAT